MLKGCIGLIPAQSSHDKGVWQQQACSYYIFFLLFSVVLAGCSITLILRCPDLPSLCFPAPRINHLLSPSSASPPLFLLSPYFFSSSLPSSPLVAANLYRFILLSIFISPLTGKSPIFVIPSILSACIVAFAFHNLPLFELFLLAYISSFVCVLCACRKIKRIAETKHLLGAANSAFKQLIHPHPTVQLCCTDSLKQDFCLMKMHQRLVNWFFTWSDLTMILSL